MSRSWGLKGAFENGMYCRKCSRFCREKSFRLSCGFGWHCVYAIEHGATHVTGIDISEKMLEEARKGILLHSLNTNAWPSRTLISTDSYDIAISSLTFHYLEFLLLYAGKSIQLFDSEAPSSSP